MSIGRGAPSRIRTDKGCLARAVHGTRTLLLKRMEARAGHFMKAGMLDSQLATLEPPHETDEVNVAVVKLGQGDDEGEERGKEAVCRDAVERARQLVG